MSRPLTMTAKQHAAHRALEHLVPALDPPDGALPDADELVALAEGRLLASDAERVRSAIAESPAARVELRALYPQVYAEMFEAAPIEIGAEVIPFRRRIVWGVGLAAAAAALFVFLRPIGPPTNFGVDMRPVQDELRRGAERGAERGTLRVEAGTRMQLSAQLGQATTLDQLRGGTPWGALIRIDSRGATVICTHSDAGCRSSAQTMAHEAVINGEGGETVQFVFLIANQPADLTDVVGPADGAMDRLKAINKSVNGRLKRLAPIEIQQP